MPEVVVAIGSNVGDSLSYLREAASRLCQNFGQLEAGKLYRTAPMYVADQPDFLNGAVLFHTHLGPLEVLRVLKALEQEIGRIKGVRFGPREIDLDLIAYGTLEYRFTDGDRLVLQVPHPRIPERRFVLAPLNDLRPGTRLPGLGIVSDLLEQTNGQSESVQEVEDALL